MRCYFCDKELIDGESKGFVCICDRCLGVAEKSEVRAVKKIYVLTKENAALARQLWLNNLTFRK